MSFIMLLIMGFAFAIAIGFASRRRDGAGGPPRRTTAPVVMLMVLGLLLAPVLLYGLLRVTVAPRVVEQSATVVTPWPPAAPPARVVIQAPGAVEQVVEPQVATVEAPDASVSADAPPAPADPYAEAIESYNASAVQISPPVIPIPEPQVWTNDWTKLIPEKSLDREPHTSTETLYAFLIDRVATECDKLGTADSTRRVLPDEGRGDIPAAFVDKLRDEIHATREKPADSGNRPQDETWVKLRWENRTESSLSWWPTQLVRGTLVARVDGPKGRSVVSAKFEDHPWLYTMPESVGRSSYLVSMSRGPETSRAEAVDSARRVAMGTITERARAELLSMPGGSRVPDSVLVDHVRGLVMRNAGMTDECAVRVMQPYGPVWYAAELRETKGVAHSAAANAIASTTQQRQTWATMIGGLAGMTLVLGLLYLGLNALTRGYFSGRLRMAVAVAGMLAVAAMLALFV
jgi:hypothetical protein